MGDVIETFIPVIVLTNVDFPADGLPITDTAAAFMVVIILKDVSLHHELFVAII